MRIGWGVARRRAIYGIAGGHDLGGIAGAIGGATGHLPRAPILRSHRWLHCRLGVLDVRAQAGVDPAPVSACCTVAAIPHRRVLH